MTPLAQRRARIYQTNHRGGRSHKTEKENMQILLLWEAGLLSEGQVAKALDMDRVAVRMLRDGAIASAMALADLLLPNERTQASAPQAQGEK